jgi:hypothetical protein
MSASRDARTRLLSVREPSLPDTDRPESEASGSSTAILGRRQSRCCKCWHCAITRMHRPGSMRNVRAIHTNTATHRICMIASCARKGGTDDQIIRFGIRIGRRFLCTSDAACPHPSAGEHRVSRSRSMRRWFHPGQRCLRANPGPGSRASGRCPKQTLGCVREAGTEVRAFCPAATGPPESTGSG